MKPTEILKLPPQERDEYIRQVFEQSQLEDIELFESNSDVTFIMAYSYYADILLYKERPECLFDVQELLIDEFIAMDLLVEDRIYYHQSSYENLFYFLNNGYGLYPLPEYCKVLEKYFYCPVYLLVKI